MSELLSGIRARLACCHSGMVRHVMQARTVYASSWRYWAPVVLAAMLIGGAL